MDTFVFQEYISMRKMEFPAPYTISTSAALLFLYASLFPMNDQFFFRQPLTSSNCRTLSLPHFFLVVDDIVELQDGSQGVLLLQLVNNVLQLQTFVSSVDEHFVLQDVTQNLNITSYNTTPDYLQEINSMSLTPHKGI